MVRTFEVGLQKDAYRPYGGMTHFILVIITAQEYNDVEFTGFGVRVKAVV